jgi:hypothetical protein
MDDPADHPTIILPFRAGVDHWKMRRQSAPLLVIEPKVVRHESDLLEDLNHGRGAVAKRVEIGRRVFGRDDAIRSSGEVNGLIGWSLRQGLPSIDFTHGDLA